MSPVALALLGLLFASPSWAATRVFEKGDALYRPLRTIDPVLKFGHTGLYVNSGSTYRFSREDAFNRALPTLSSSNLKHSIIHAPGYKHPDGSAAAVEVESFEGGSGREFLNTSTGEPFWGAYSKLLDATQRRDIIFAAGEQIGAKYTLFAGWRGNAIIPGRDPKFRCDGLVHFAYADPQVNAAIPLNLGGLFFANAPSSQRDKLTRRSQATAPACRPTSVTPSGGSFVLTMTDVKDDLGGSGIDRVEFYDGLPASVPTLAGQLGTDDHDSNPGGGMPESEGPSTYSINSFMDPGSNLYTAIYDQSGNYSVCDASGSVQRTSDLVQFAANIVEDVAPPTLDNLMVEQQSGGETAKATWTPSDNQTPAANLNYFYAVDVPFEQWDDPDVSFLGQRSPPEYVLDITNLSEGEHTFYLVAFDQEGNIGATSQNFTIARPPTVAIIDYNQLGNARDWGPFTGSTMTLTDRLWLHNRQPAEGIRFQASSPGGVSALKVVGLDAAGEPDESKLYADINLDSPDQEVFFVDGTLPDAPGYLVSARTGSTTTVYFGVDSVPPTLSFGLNVSPDFEVGIVGISSDATSGVAETFLSTGSSPGDMSRVSTGAPGAFSAPFELPIAQQACGETAQCASGFVVARDVGGLAAAFNPVYVSQEQNVHPIYGAGHWSPAFGGYPAQDAANRLIEYQAGSVGGCVHRDPLPAACQEASPPPECAAPSGPCGSWSLKVRAGGVTLTPSTTVPITVEGAFIGEMELAGGPVISTTPFDVSGQPGLLLGATVAMRLDIVDGTDPYFTPSQSGSGWFRMNSLLIIASINPDAPVISTGIYPSVEIGGTRVYFGEVAAGPERRVWISQVPITPPEGQRFVPGNPEVATDIATLASFTNGVHVRLRFNSGSLNAEQAAQVKMWHRGTGGWEDVTTWVDLAKSEVWGESLTASPFAVFISSAALGEGGVGSPDLTPPVTTLGFTGFYVSTAGAAGIINESSSVTLTAVDSGVGQIQTFYAIDPSSALLVGGLNAGTTEAFSAYDAPFSLPPGRRLVAYGSVDGAGNYEVLRSTEIVIEDSTVDIVPPVTSVGFNGFSTSIEGAAAFIYEASSVVLSAVDQGSGLARIFYVVDPSSAQLNAGLSDATTSAFQIYADGGFTLPLGRWTLAYGAVDLAGNYEVLRSTVIEVGQENGGGEDGPSVGGMGIGKDALDTFWTVVTENEATALAHADSSGVLISSSTLEGGGSDFPWSVFFDAEGRAYAIGVAEGPATQALDVAVFKASPAGDAIESRTLFDSGHASNDLVFDAKAPGWIVGSAQTSGPTDFEDPGEVSFSMALWRFDPALGTIQLKTTYARAGFDLGAGLAVDPDGSLWISGYSLSPEAPEVGGFDLALWHYAADGQTLLGGPYLRPGYLNDLDAQLATRIHVSSQAVFIAASRSNSSGGTDMAFLRYDKSSGQPIAETVWRSVGGGSSYPAAMLPEASGMLVAGGIDADSTEAALWRFGFDGSLQSVTKTDAGGATGAVFRDNELWLSVSGSTMPYRVQDEAAAAGALVDLAPPRTSLTAGEPSFAGDSIVYVTSATPLGFAVVDDYLVLGDGLGAGATQTFYAEVGSSYARFTSSFTLVAEGTHTLSFYSVDLEGRVEAVKTQSVGVDLTAPVVTLVSSGTLFSISALDPVVAGAASGVGQIYYLVDLGPDCPKVEQSTAAAPGTCENLSYAGSFELAPGTHTIHYAAEDRVANGAEVVYSSFVTVGPPIAGPVLTPSSGPIGVPFSISGAGFGTYGGANTVVKFGVSTAPVSVWNDETISGTVPGLSTGAYAVTLERLAGSTLTITEIGAYVVTPLIPSLATTSGPIGLPFTLSGPGFGTFSGANTRVLIAGATAPVSVWNDATIAGTVPGVEAGATTLIVERRTADGFVSQSEPLPFTVTVPSITAVVPSSAPIGAGFTLTGWSFGNYAGTNTQVLFDGTTAPVSVWNDTTIVGTVPGALPPGEHELVVERRTADGFAARSSSVPFTVAGLWLAAVGPSTGAIGIPFTLTGAGFGSYLGANSRVRFGVSTAAVSVWTDGSIAGTVPTLATGAYAVTVERQQGTGISVSNASTFTVISPEIAAVTPSSGPIGTVFTLSGTGFGPFAGANTFLLLDGATTPISVWNDTTITATAPGSLTPGVKELTAVRRNADGGLSASNTINFEVTGMSIASINPSTGPIGIPFTIKGSQFGVFLGANSRVRFGVSTAAVSVWNDTTISGTLPALSTGAHAVVIERQQGTDITFSAPSSFTVTELAVGALTPSSGPIGVAFTITGAHFGPFAGANTRLLLGGTTVAVSVWNDTTITGTVPNLEAGSQPLWLERKSGTGVQSSATTFFLVTTPEVATLVPSSAPIGAPFTITGTSFGPYAGTNTRVKFNGVVAAVSLWNDVKIVGTVPGAVSTGTAVLVVERAVGAGVSSSAEQAFEVLRPAISTVTPGYGPAGTVVTLTGHGFGPYAGTATKLLVGGSTVTVSVWNDTTIRWTVTTAFSDGDYALVVRREPAGGVIESEPASFTVGTGYGGASFGFSEPLSLAAQPDVNFEGGLNLPVDEGGRVETASKAAVDVPANALEEDTVITLKRLRPDGLRTEAAGENKKRAAGEAIDFGPAGTLFKTPVTIELPYDAALAGDETSLAVHYYDPLRRAWEELPSVVDRVRRVVRAQTAHFSIYQPMGLAPQTAAQDEFYFRDQYAFPNPSRGGAVTFRIQPGLADAVELRVYDLSGRRVHSSTDFTLRVVDDLNGKGPQNTYDHVWGVSGVGSGVYNYVIKASRAGSAPIVKKGKVGVIK